MKRDQSGTFLSAVFVDYDNIYMSLKRKSEDAAKRFAKDAQVWLREIESGRLITPTNGPGTEGVRRIVMNRCYGNPVPRRNTSDNSTDMSSFPFVRHHFLRSGFEIVDCPPLTAQLKNSSDIRMVMDVRDYLTHPTYFDEFIILSGDADFTPVLHRLRAHARRTVIFANDYTAAPYTAISDGEVRESDLISLLIEGRLGETSTNDGAGQPDAAAIDAIRRDIVADVVAAVKASNAPVPLEVLADRAVRAIGHDKTIGTSWAGAGGFRDLLTQALPEGLRVSGEPPYVVIDIKRHVAIQPAPALTHQPAAPVEPVEARVERPAAPIQPPVQQQTHHAIAAATSSGIAREIPAPRNLAVPASMNMAIPPQQPQQPQLQAQPAPAPQPAPQATYQPPQPTYHHQPMQQQPAMPQQMAEPVMPPRQRMPEYAAPQPPVPQPQPLQPQQRAPEPAGSSHIQQSIARIHEACQAPPLAPPEYRMLFEVMAQEITDNGLVGAQTIANITQRAQERGVDVRRDDVRFVLEVVSEADPWFEQGATANLFAGRFRNFVVARCRSQGLNLSADELDLIEAWFAGTAPMAPPARQSQPMPQPAAALPSPTQQQAPMMQPPQGRQAPQTAPPQQDPRQSYWSLDESRQAMAADHRAPMARPAATAMEQPPSPQSDDFPRIVRTRLRG